MKSDITQKFDNLTNLEDNMRKLNQVLETSIKSSYRTRYEYNLNDYKKNFETASYKESNYLDEKDNFDKGNININAESSSKNIVEDFQEEDNVISSKRFFAEKNSNFTKNPKNEKNNFVDKSYNYKNTINLKNKNNRFADFEEVERMSPKKTSLNNNLVKSKEKDFQPKTTYNTDYSYTNQISNSPKINNQNDFESTNNGNANFNNNNNQKAKNTFDLNSKKNHPITNFAELNHQFESFNLDDVLKTADTLSKNKKSVKVDNRRVEISYKVYDIQNLKKINVANPKGNNSNNNTPNNDYLPTKFYSATDKKIYDNDNFNTYSDTNFTNNSKKEEDEFDYLKNLLMKTQMEIQNFNQEFDNDCDFKNIYRNKSEKNPKYSSFKPDDKLHFPDSEKDTFPRKQAKPTKPVI